MDSATIRIEPTDNEPLSFRPGPTCGACIRELAQRWELTRTETARRLIVLGMTGFTPGDYELLNELVELRGSNRTESFYEIAAMASNRIGDFARYTGNEVTAAFRTAALAATVDAMTRGVAVDFQKVSA